MKMTDVVAMIDAANPVAAVRGPYKKREAAEISNGDTTWWHGANAPIPAPYTASVTSVAYPAPTVAESCVTRTCRLVWRLPKSASSSAAAYSAWGVPQAMV